MFPDIEHQIRWQVQRFQPRNTKFVKKRSVSEFEHHIRWQAQRFQILNAKSADGKTFPPSEH